MRPMTREEWMQAYLRDQKTNLDQEFRPAQLPPGMMTQSAVDNSAAYQTFDAQNARIAKQRDMARMLSEQSAQSPGIITAGNISVAGANPLTALAQGIRGYQSGSLSRKADEGTQEVMAQEQAQAAAKQRLAAQVESARLAERSQDRGFAVSDAETAYNREKQLAEQKAKQALTLKKTLGPSDQLALNKGEVTSFHDPENPEATVNYVIDALGRSVPADENIRNLTPRKPGQLGSRAPTKAELDAAGQPRRDEEERLKIGSVYRNILRNPSGDNILYEGSGINLESLLGRTGLPLSEQSPAIQDFQRNVQQLKFKGVATNLEELDLKPVTEGEYKETAKGNVDWNTQPFGLVSYIADTDLPLYKSRIREANFEEGSPQQIRADAFVDDLEKDLIYAATTVDPETKGNKPTMPLSMLSSKGVDVAGIQKRLSTQAKEQGIASLSSEDRELLIRILKARKQESGSGR